MKKAVSFIVALVCMFAVFSGCNVLPTSRSETSYTPQMLIAPFEEDFEIPEFSGVKFRQDEFEIMADGKPIMENGLISDIYLADFNDDGFPEICGVVDRGSGVTVMTVIAYDFHNNEYYSCPSPKGGFWWNLDIKGGKLVAIQRRKQGDEEIYREAVLSIVDGKLIADGIKL